VPPFAVGVLILFAAFFPDLRSQLQMVALAFGLLLADLVAMRHARRILAVIGAGTLQVLGAVFGVLQLALGDPDDLLGAALHLRRHRQLSRSAKPSRSPVHPL
jgi:hypothetical protein